MDLVLWRAAYLESDRSVICISNLEKLRHFGREWPYTSVRIYWQTIEYQHTVEAQLHRIDFDGHGGWWWVTSYVETVVLWWCCCGTKRISDRSSSKARSNRSNVYEEETEGRQSGWKGDRNLISWEHLNNEDGLVTRSWDLQRRLGSKFCRARRPASFELEQAR